MKRKFGNRKGWGRITKQQYVQHYVADETFKGYVTLLKFDEVLHPLWSNYTSRKICLVENGSYMLQQYPENAHYSMITYFSPDGRLLQWYIDITYATGVENGIPYMDDLYLDLIVVPNEEVIEKDKDELEEALLSNDITQQQFDFAHKIFNEVKVMIATDNFPLFKLSRKQFEFLLKKL